jgi:hypothetical protein
MQEVQFSSSSAITPRLRGGRCGGTSGYSAVCVGLARVRAVVARPLRIPGTAPPLLRLEGWDFAGWELVGSLTR